MTQKGGFSINLLLTHTVPVYVSPRSPSREEKGMGDFFYSTNGISYGRSTILHLVFCSGLGTPDRGSSETLSFPETFSRPHSGTLPSLCPTFLASLSVSLQRGISQTYLSPVKRLTKLTDDEENHPTILVPSTPGSLQLQYDPASQVRRV